MKRIIWHWTAGGGRANATDRKHYHFIIEADGTVIPGNHPPEANQRPIAKPNDTSTYAAHTARANTDALSISLAGMRGAKERPFDAGPSPITPAQVGSLVKLTAKLCQQYVIPVERDTTLSHAEVQPTLGIAQRGKWDITWLPGMDGPGDPVQIGDQLRARVRFAMNPVTSKPVDVSETPKSERQNPPVSLINRIFSFLNKGGPA